MRTAASSGNFNWSGSKSIYLNESAGNDTYGNIQSMDSDGYTVSWTKIGATTGTASIIYLALR